MASEAFPLIEISGAPYERGRLYGAAATARIEASIALYGGAVERLGLSASRLYGLVAAFLPRMAEFDDAYVEEMRGIADGSGRTLTEIVLVNARTEILQLAKREAAADKDGCTGVVVLPEAAAAGRLIHAQNWDWRAECAGTGVVLKIRRNEGPDLLTFTEAGGLARSGFNSAGVALTGNYLESDRDYRQLGVPLPLIRRKALEQTHVALAMRAVAITPKSASNNMMVSHSDGFAIDFECAPDEAFWINPESGLLVHANHWVSPAARAKLRETGLSSVPESLYRDTRVRAYLAAQAGRITTAHVKAALADDWQSPYAVCRPPAPALVSDSIAATVCTILMVPAEGRMEIAPAPWLGAAWTEYRLEMDGVTASTDPVTAAAE